MTKKLLVLTSAFVLSIGSLFSQNNNNALNGPKLSGTPAPPQQWEEWFGKEVQKFKETKLQGKSQFASFTIPVIFHVLHTGQAIGTAPNISAARIGAQLNALNQIYNGVGANPNSIAQYSTFVSSPNISFCLATADPTNIPLGEPGINRIDMTALLAANTGTMNNDNQLLSFIEYTVKPAIIWDPSRYLNIFVAEKGPNATVLGSATYPPGTSLIGLGAIGTGTTDGVWVVSSAVGSGTNPGTLANYTQGKTLAREIGHYLGLRTLWGDAVCGSDYCNDTPPQNGPNYACPGSYPVDANSCGVGLSPMGEMSMNIMDWTYDDCRYMFTADQVVRMHTAMCQSPLRSLLGTHGLCTSTVALPPAGGAYASFSLTAPAPCFGQAFTPVNTSTGSPAPTFTWVLTPNTATVNSGYNVAMPSFNLSNQGSYTLTLIASNSLATTSQTYTFTTTICPKNPTCLDTLKAIRKTDTLSVYSVNSSTSVIGCNVVNPGYLTGTNCYKDKEFAQYFAGSSYSNVPVPQLSGVYVLFNKTGTKSNSGTADIKCNVWGGSFIGGPTTLLHQKSVPLANITATSVSSWSTIASPTNNVTWCGTPTYTFGSMIVLPYKINIDPPYLLPTNGFNVGIEMPWTSSMDSCLLFTNSVFNAPISDSSAFVRTQTDNWFKLFKHRGKNVQLAIMPEITCKAKVGVNEYKNELEANLMVMPNPNNGVFSILATLNTQQNLTFKIMNYLGQTIGENREQDVTRQVFQLDMSNHPNGVYFIEISNGTQKTTKKVVISK